ncbi:hypothetical protein [Sphingobacterium composti Ten et al. 2007 non Yoo et al. 2007]|uniref:hypothetical protein n=1 Tax=Sphingobacterium composti TaxID=363260 RepID=UPI0013598024|nr:hypothetical protein [Sphingobacterium composti Ten et al. 2007 non Yoo et al. 2007]
MKELLSYSKLELPFADFEDNMLQKIQEDEIKKKAAEKYKFFSHVCFLAGIILGFLINYLMSKNLNELIPNSDLQEKLNSGIQLFYVVMIVLFANKLWGLSKMDLRNIFK